MAEMVRVEEAYIERDETINAQGAVMEIEIPYLVFGVADESAALGLLKGASPFEDASLFYWHKESRNSNAEVDYIVQFRDKVLPISRRRSNPHHPSLHDR